MTRTSYVVEREAARLGRLSLTAARREFGQRLEATSRLEGDERAVALDFNARLATALRERNVPMWGDEEKP